MHDSPFFSIILPTHNRAAFLSKAIDSVLKQTFRDWELIVVDDGSTDRTAHIVASYTDARIKYIYQENQERCVARNNGINHAQGAYVGFLDDDDYVFSNHLESFYNVISLGGYGQAVYYCNTYYEKNGKVYKFFDHFCEEKSSKEFVFRNIIATPRAMIPAEFAKRYKFNETIRVGEDRELWVRLAEQLSFVCTNEYTAVCVIHQDRTVAISNETAYVESLRTIKLMSKSDYCRDISRRNINIVLGDMYFALAKHYLFVSNNIKAIQYLLRSLWPLTYKYQKRHRILLVMALLMESIFKIKNPVLNEYR